MGRPLGNLGIYRNHKEIIGVLKTVFTIKGLFENEKYPITTPLTLNPNHTSCLLICFNVNFEGVVPFLGLRINYITAGKNPNSLGDHSLWCQLRILSRWSKVPLEAFLATQCYLIPTRKNSVDGGNLAPPKAPKAPKAPGITVV